MEDEQPGFIQRLPERIVIGLVTLLVIYVLSVGPAARWAHDKHDPRYYHYVDSFYAPVLWVCGDAKPTRSMLIWYVKVWDPDVIAH